MSKIILFQGDSITDAERSRDNELYPGHGYPTLVKARLGADHVGEYTFYNRGISGNRIVDLYARVKRDIINLKPDYVSILIGVNDVWAELDSHTGVDTAQFEMIYHLLISEIKEAIPSCKVMLLEPFVLEGASTQSTNEQPERWQTFQHEVKQRAEAVRRVAAKNGLVFVALQTVFDEAARQTEPSYWLWDGVHPTSMGYELISREWIRAFALMQ